MRKNADIIMLCLITAIALPALLAALFVSLGFYTAQGRVELEVSLLVGGACAVVATVTFAFAARQLFMLETNSFAERQLARENNEYHKYISEHDMLTNLYNKDYLQRTFNSFISGDKRIALLFLDLDNFKQINDLMGHNVGDMLLRKVAEKLLSTAQNGEYIARVGGDEFVLLKVCKGKSDVESLGNRVKRLFDEPIKLFNSRFEITASIGAAIYPDNGWDFQEIYKNADTAMYESKRSGKGRFSLYAPAMQEQILEKYEILKYVREYERHCFVEYQPIVNLTSGALNGFEALIRMQVDGKVIPPSEFIPVAANNSLLADIGRFVLREAAEFVTRCEDQSLDFNYVSVNISATQFFEEGFLQHVKDVLASTNVNPKKLLFELTEDIVVKYDEVKKIFHDINELGISMGIDDFGTGYSSLSHLANLPLSLLKIDKSFVDAMDDGGKEARIIESIISLSSALQMNTCAEGIEKAPQAANLQRLGCTLGQGYLFSKPLKSDYIEQNFPLILTRIKKFKG